MRKRIFYGIFSASICVCLACLVVIISALYGYYSTQYEADIRQTAHYLATGANTSGDDFIYNLDKQYKDRVTLIDKNGKVLFDNIKDASTMENHSDREEFIGAVKNGKCEISRYSSTLSEKTYYSALLLKNGKVLRVSGTQFTVLTLAMNMLQPILIVVVIAVGLSYILAIAISKKIMAPINAIDLENPKHIEDYEELTPLTDKILYQNRQIKEQIKQLNIEHEQRDKMRREFTANVSHELKTPLTSISGFAEIMRDGLVKDEDIKRFAGKIYDEAGRLITLVGDIIEISRLDEQSDVIEKTDVELSDICKNVCAHLQSAAAKRSIKVNLTTQSAVVNGCEKILYDLVYNICDNAIKYNKEGGRVDIDLKNADNKVVLSVKDTGIGIPKEDRERVFERFYRVDKSHSKEIGGTGLGLSIVKHAALFHNAEIHVDSTLGVGTTIEVVFDKANAQS